MRRFLLSLSVMLAFTPSTLNAQENDDKKFQFGITLPRIGVIWHITDNIALNPNVSFFSEWEQASGNMIQSDSDSDSITVYANLRFYIQEWKKMRFYISPSYVFGWRQFDLKTQYESYPPGTIRTGISTQTIYEHGVGGQWGLQYDLMDRLSLYGQIGAQYRRSISSRLASYTTSDPTTEDGISNGIYTAGEFGLILYLK